MLTLKTAFRKMDSSFEGFQVEKEYQKRLASPLAELCRCRAVPTIVDTDLLCLPGGLSHLYFIPNHGSASRAFH